MDQSANVEQAVDDSLNNVTDIMYNPPSVSSSSSASSSPTFTNFPQQSIPNLKDVCIKIVEQPAPKELRFRYICEGRSAGSIPGVNSTSENRTFPTIEIDGYEGKVKVVVSCVTKDPPYRPHPHNLVGKEGCENGICLATINGPPMRVSFTNLGIQCVKKKDIKAALEERERKRIDPYKTTFAHKDQQSSIDASCVRLCFQAFIPIPGLKKPFTIPPVVSEPIYDKKSINELVICRLCSCSAKVTGGDTIILLCEKLPKEDIKIRFFENSTKTGLLYWEDFAQIINIHKQAAITFKTPRYKHPEIKHPVQVFIQLYRPADDETSEPREFQFYPDPDSNRKRSKIDDKLLRELRQQSQSQSSFANSTNVDNYSMWNNQPHFLNPSGIPGVNPEPLSVPDYYAGSYRNTYQTSPSPQPTSPMMIHTIDTPSPGVMRNSSAETQTQMSMLYNQSQMNQNLTNTFAVNINDTQSQISSGFNEYNNNNNSNQIFNAKNPFLENVHANANEFNNNNVNFNIINHHQITQFTTPVEMNNNFINHTSGGTFTPIYGNDNVNGNNNINPGNTINNIQQFQAVDESNNLSINQSQDSNAMLDSVLSWFDEVLSQR